MTLSMPPTMILMVSPFPPFPLEAEVRESRQALNDRAVAAARAAAVTRLTVRMSEGSLYLCFEAGCGWTPAQEAFLEDGEQPFGQQRDYRDDDHSGEDARRVERAQSVVDEQAETLVGTAVLPDDRADDGEAERRVQRGEDPEDRAGHDDRAQYLHPAGAQDPGVVHQVAVDLPGALEGVEERREGGQDERGGHLGGHAEAEPDDEQRGQDDAGDRVGGLDERRAHVGQEPAAAQHDAEHDAARAAERETDQGLFEGGRDLLPDRALRGSVRDPVAQPVPARGRL